MLNLAIKTIDRSPGPNYLGQTLRNLDRAGVLSSKRIGACWIVDGGSPDVEAYLKGQGVPKRFKIDSAKRTLHQNAARCIELAAGADWALVLEDDVDVCADFLGSVARWLEAHADPRFALYTFGAALPEHVEGELWECPAGSFHACQALAWRGEDAQACATWLGPDPRFRGSSAYGHGLLLREWVGERKIAATVPSFVQHCGAESSLGHGFFAFPSWPGPGWAYEAKGSV